MVRLLPHKTWSIEPTGIHTPHYSSHLIHYKSFLLVEVFACCSRSSWQQPPEQSSAVGSVDLDRQNTHSTLKHVLLPSLPSLHPIPLSPPPLSIHSPSSHSPESSWDPSRSTEQLEMLRLETVDGVLFRSRRGGQGDWRGEKWSFQILATDPELTLCWCLFGLAGGADVTTFPGVWGSMRRTGMSAELLE